MNKKEFEKIIIELQNAIDSLNSKCYGFSELESGYYDGKVAGL